MQLPRFEDLAASPDATLDLLALALAAAFRPVDAARALATLDGLGEEVADVLRSAGTREAEALVLSAVLGTRHGFRGDSEHYDRPENSMLDRVLERRRGLPILLSIVYVEVARRAACPWLGSGCPATTSSGTSARPSRCCWTRSAAACGSSLRCPRRSCARGLRTRRRCECSTTSSRRSGAAAISPARCAPPTCGWRCRPARTSATTCARSSPAFVPTSTEHPVVASRSTAK